MASGRLPGLSLRPGQWAVVAGLTGYAVVAGAGLSALVGSGASRAAVVVLAVLAAAGLALLLALLIGRVSSLGRRLAADTRVIVDANPTHRLDPVEAGELHQLAVAVNRLAERRLAAEREVHDQVRAARREMESERNRLAALMAQLTVAVVVCNIEGRILLYNDAARTVVGDDAPLGLGRSVFGVVDRALIAHVHDRLATGDEPVHAATTLRGDRLLRVRVALVRDADDSAASGFVLVLEDLTRQVRAADQRERLLRRLTEGTRASLGSIRAAVESVLDFPDLTPEQRRRFLEIVRDESDALGARVDEWAAESVSREDDLLLTDVSAASLLAVLGRELRRTGTEVATADVPDDLWLRADSHALARTLVHLLTRLRQRCGVQQVTLAVTASGRHGQLDARWAGPVPSSAEFAGWLDEGVAGALSATARDVADRHGAEVWCGEGVGGTGYLRMLLPLATETTARPVVRPVRTPIGSRPEFYDFDLFTTDAEDLDWQQRRLDALSFTVLDTETTGLDPAGGDRVVSLAAVRVVNGRVLRQETLERLVQPERAIPPAATAIHGISADMLTGAPTLAQVLPALARFAEDTVLVGHNVGFDLQFLRQAEAAAGVRLDQPALDTLLLDAALHPDHEDHTLEAIAARLGVSVVGRHTALGDALVTAEVFVGLLSVLRRRGITTLGEAIAAARETFHARVDESLYGR